jgi:hypothetical protein
VAVLLVKEMVPQTLVVVEAVDNLMVEEVVKVVRVALV